MGLQKLVYNNSPWWFQNVLCTIVGKQQMALRFNDKYEEIMVWMRKSQFASADEITRYKEEHISKVLEYAYQHVPYYRNTFKAMGLTPADFKSLEDLKKFPILTKEDIREHWQEMVSEEYTPKQMIEFHTSGTSGKALNFYLSKESVPYNWACSIRLRERYGVKLMDRKLNFTGKDVAPVISKPPYWRINKAQNQWLLNQKTITPDHVEAIVEMMEKVHFRYFTGYPSILDALANMMIDKGLIVNNAPVCYLSGAEKMYDDQRTRISKCFPGMAIGSGYGQSERVVSASMCPEESVYHEDYEFGHLECENPTYISDTDYSGTMIGTGFTNYAMPFIRYRIGDRAIWSTKVCSCGRHSQILKDIEGRIEDYVYTPEGARIGRCDYIFKGTLDIKEAQIVQRELGAIVIRVVRRDGYSINTENEIKELVKEYISPTLKVTFEYVTEIERTNAGKFRAIVNLIK